MSDLFSNIGGLDLGYQPKAPPPVIETAYGFSLRRDDKDAKLAGIGPNPFKGDAIGDTLRKYVPKRVQQVLGGPVADALIAPEKAINETIAAATDYDGWFTRIAIGVFALIFIAAALFAFKSGDVMSIATRARKVIK